MQSNIPLLRPSRFPFVAAILLAGAWIYAFRGIPLREAPTGQGTVVLQDVSVFDPLSGKVLTHRDLSWTDGRITAVRPTGDPLPLDAERISGKGFTALPGFCDAAVYLSLEGRYPQDSVPADAALNLRSQMRSGTTALLDLNAHRNFIHHGRKVLAESGPWPRVRFAGALFTAPGGWRLGGQTPWDSHVAEVAEVEDLQASWPFHIRFRDEAIFASVEHEGRDGLAIPLPVLKRLGELAHSQGQPFIIHAQHASKALASLEAKPDAILGPLLDDEGAAELGQALRHQGCRYIPALSSLLNAWPARDHGEEWARQGTVEDQGPALIARAKETGMAAAWQRRLQRQNLQRPAVLNALLTLYLSKVSLAWGTGSGLPLTFHGSSFVSELELWHEAGVPTAAALRAATLNSHRLLGLQGGRLREGRRADVVLVQGDPLRTPLTLASPQSIWVGGVALERP